MILILLRDVQLDYEYWVNPEYIISMKPTKQPTSSSDMVTLIVTVLNQSAPVYVDAAEVLERYPAMFHLGLTDEADDEDDDTDDTPTIDAALQDYRKGQI
jgi:hypothetical protein